MLQIMNHFSGLFFVCVISALQLVVKPQEVSVDLDNEAITLQTSFIRKNLKKFCLRWFIQSLTCLPIAAYPFTGPYIGKAETLFEVVYLSVHLISVVLYEEQQQEEHPFNKKAFNLQEPGLGKCSHVPYLVGDEKKCEND